MVLSVTSPLRADELRSDEGGVSIPVPEGWTRRTTKLSATTVLALELTDPKAEASEPRSTILVNSLEMQAVDEKRAFEQAREYLPKPGDVVERPTGRYLRVDFDYEATDASGGKRKLFARVYAGLREKKLYYFILTTK